MTDNSPLLKVNNHGTLHFTNVSWTLNKSGLKVSKVTAREKGFSIYPNPTDGVFYIRGKQDFSKNIKIEIYDASGKLLSAKSEMKDSSTLSVDIQYAPSGSYLLNVVEDDQPIISQKIIKE